MRVLVCGGRRYMDEGALNAVLASLFLFGAPKDGVVSHHLRDEDEMEDDVIIQGAATGADRMARKFAKANQVRCEQYNADWENMDVEPCIPRTRSDGSVYNAAAGGIRNQRMLDEGKPDVVIAFPGGKGTADMIKRAKAAGVEVIEIAEQQPPRTEPSQEPEQRQD